MKALKGLMATRCGIGSYMLMLVFLLSFGCATVPPGQPVDWASETMDRLDRADLTYSILLGSFRVFRAEGVLDAAICTAGEGMATESDAKFAISGVMAPPSFTTLETVFLETPRILAKSVKEMDRGTKW